MPGELLKSLFGYNGNPALTEALAYVAYLVAIGWALRRRRASGTSRHGQRVAAATLTGVFSMSKQRAALPKQTAAPTRHLGRRPDRTSWAWIGGGLLAVILVVGGVWLATRSARTGRAGQRFPIQGQQHIQAGQTHPAYNSDPPTSGWHYDTPLASGFHEQPVADEQLVHNLEHGHVVIAYDLQQARRLCEREDADPPACGALSQLEGHGRAAAERRRRASHSPPGAGLDKLDGFDEARITAFVNAWRDRGPERTEE